MKSFIFVPSTCIRNKKNIIIGIMRNFNYVLEIQFLIMSFLDSYTFKTFIKKTTF